MPTTDESEEDQRAYINAYCGVSGVIIVESYPFTRDASHDLIGLRAWNSSYRDADSLGVIRHSRLRLWGSPCCQARVSTWRRFNDNYP